MTSLLNGFDPSIRRLLLWSVFFHCLAAIFSEGYYHPDEQFQILEFISLKLGKATPPEMPWEYAQKMRPWLQPFCGWVIAKVVFFIGIVSPFVLAFFYRLLSGLLGWLSVVVLAKITRPFFSDSMLYLRAVAGLSLLWFFPYLHVRFSSEGWATTFFTLGFCALWTSLEKKGNKATWLAFMSGVGWGVAAQARYAVLLMIFSVVLYLLIYRRKIRPVLTMSAGFLLLSLVGVGVDHWGYGTWQLSMFSYFRANLVENRISNFGVSPWWMYFRSIPFDAMPWCGWPLIAGTLFGLLLFPNHVLSWVIAPFLLFHFLLGHKETRFLFPIASFSLLLALKSVERVSVQGVKRWLLQGWGYRLFCGLNFGLLVAACLKPACNEMPVYRAIYKRFPPAKKLLALEEDPFVVWNLRVHFYAPEQLLVRMPSLQESAASLAGTWKPPIYVATHLFFLPEDFGLKGCIPIYRTLPAFVVRFNYFHWIERTPLWSIFECGEQVALDNASFPNLW